MTSPDTPSTPHATAARRWGWWLLVAAAALIVVLVQYRNPHFLVSMADQLWGCF